MDLWMTTTASIFYKVLRIQQQHLRLSPLNVSLSYDLQPYWMTIHSWRDRHSVRTFLDSMCVSSQSGPWIFHGPRNLMKHFASSGGRQPG